MPYIARNYHVRVTGRRKGTDDQHTAVYLVRANTVKQAQARAMAHARGVWVSIDALADHPALTDDAQHTHRLGFIHNNITEI